MFLIASHFMMMLMASGGFFADFICGHTKWRQRRWHIMTGKAFLADGFVLRRRANAKMATTMLRVFILLKQKRCWVNMNMQNMCRGWDIYTQLVHQDIVAKPRNFRV